MRMRTIPMNARLFAPILGAALGACSCGGSPAGSVAPGSTTPEQVAPESRTAGPSADYEVHEWGLVRGGAGDTQHYGVLAPPVDYGMMTVDKPVLYFHAPAALTLASVGVEARSGGTLLETWPLTPLGSSAVWTNVSIDPAGECTPSPLPATTEAPCAALPATDSCETPTLANIRTPDAACVHVGASTERFLFYRGRASTFTPPLRFERTGAYETVRVTNEGDAVIPGMIVRLWSDGYRVRTLVVAPPPPHQSVDVHADFDAAEASDHTRAASDDRRGASDEDMPVMPTTGPGREATMQSMLTIGLTQSEADAFMRAWEPALFGPGRTAIDTLSVDGDLAPQESFLYFLPAASLESLAHLDFDPPPRGGVHRAIAMWSALRASGASH
jgi:hypothetical protein